VDHLTGLPKVCPVWAKIDSTEHKIIGQTLVSVRKKAGVTQDQLVTLLGKPQSAISEYETGNRRIDLLELLLILDTLKAEPIEVLGAILEKLRAARAAE
jgi:transcriptional regulator with XRE-family HTH domain